MDNKSNTLVLTPDTPFVFIDLRESDGWERVESLLAGAQDASAEKFSEQTAPRPVKKWDHQ